MSTKNCRSCAHCHHSVDDWEDVVSYGDFRYHAPCYRCYVCSTADLERPQVFKGVLFCGGCAARIFKAPPPGVRPVSARHIMNEQSREMAVLYNTSTTSEAVFKGFGYNTIERQPGMLQLSRCILPNPKENQSQQWEQQNLVSIGETQIGKQLSHIVKYPYKMLKKNILSTSGVVKRFRRFDNAVSMSSKTLRRAVMDVEKQDSTYCSRGGVEMIFRASTSRGCPLHWYNRGMQTKSYMRMRRKVMSLAGPTEAELAAFKKKIKLFITRNPKQNPLRPYSPKTSSHAMGTAIQYKPLISQEQSRA